MSTNGSFHGPLKVFGCNAGSDFTDAVCALLDVERGKALVGQFNDGEVRVRVDEDVRGADAFVINPTSQPERNFTELKRLCSALRSSAVGRLTVVIPYLGYARQERSKKNREALSAQDVIREIMLCEPSHVVLLDIHAAELVANFRPAITSHLFSALQTMPYLEELFSIKRKEIVVASPDAGGVARARKYMEMLGFENLVFFHKHRDKPGEVEEVRLVGKIRDKHLLLVDDLADSLNTLDGCANLAKEEGAKSITAILPHGVFSPGAIERLEASHIDQLIITDSIPITPEVMACEKISVISVTPLFAKAIRRVHDGRSMSDLFLG